MLDDEDLSPFLAACAPDVTVEYPADGRLPYGGAWHGRDGVGRFLDAHDGAEEIVEFAPAEMLRDGGRVVVLGRFAGRAKPTGTPWSTRFVHLLTFDDGLLQRWEAYFDTAAAVEAHA
jgi:ketosteroid isomerase-like protein